MPQASHTSEPFWVWPQAGQVTGGMFGWRFEPRDPVASRFRAAVIRLGAELPRSLEPALDVLADTYRFVAWNEGNDFVSTDREFMERRAERGARRQELAESEDLHRAAQEAKKREREAALPFRPGSRP